MDIPLYLARIRFSRPIKRDVQTLHGLQAAHMQNIAFENLDIGRKRPIRLSEEALWDKLILRRRGGFCYEINGLFARLLQEIGFQVTYLNARVFHEREGIPGIDFGHLALLVQIPGSAGRWLVDAGFGDSFEQPLCLEEREEHVQGLRAYRLEQTPGGYITWQRKHDGSWERQYFFDLQPRSFPGDYEAACLYHQTSPRSSFTRGSIISRATPDGRVSLEDRWLILTRDGRRSRQEIQSREEYNALLKQYFDIALAEEQT